ncbi:protein containing DUF1703 [Candidatus Omnitrophus magneticus]|uniref:Protein containing DUF1703 n=1 Tax=Candidatus Omnitrophus magneticus TaxID=1609969 RepID=A0A0F0CRE8_9BACT|nr:protein containing DUF1703 [Candidatus Omnitrophus magneticus]
MRNFLSGGFKDNTSLEKGVLTGILRVSKESIFSGMNNLGVFTILSHKFSDKFGLTEEEVKKTLEDYKLSEKLEEVRHWYNGYIFGEKLIYNPWSIINYAANPLDGFQTYWANTSDNKIINGILTKNGEELKQELLYLIEGAGVEKLIEENIIFSDIDQLDSVLWSFLLFSGYLKQSNKRWNQSAGGYFYELKIPNQEIITIYQGIIRRWFERRMENDKQKVMTKALMSGDIKLFERLLKELVASVFSYHDFTKEPEKVYQAFIIGLFVWIENEYEIKSDREAGYGRADVIMIPRDKKRIGFVIEFKSVDEEDNETVEIAVEKALAQIEERKYDLELTSRGIEKIKKLAIVFQGKKVCVRENKQKF